MGRQHNHISLYTFLTQSENMPAKVKSAAILAKEAADAAAILAASDSFDDASDVMDDPPGILKDFLMYMKMQEQTRIEERKHHIIKGIIHL